MRTVSVPVAYMPLVDAAPLIVAQEMGFAEAEGVALELIPAPSWSSVRDMLAFGRVDAAHMLSPVPVAMAMGLGGVSTALSAVSVLSVNGNVIGVGRVRWRTGYAPLDTTLISRILFGRPRRWAGCGTAQ